MSVASSTRYSAFGPVLAGTVDLNIDWPVNDPALDLAVWRRRGGVVTVLAPAIGWSFVPATLPTVGGKVVLAAAALASDEYLVFGNYTPRRDANLTLGDRNSTKKLNREFDRLWMTLQEIDGGFDRLSATAITVKTGQTRLVVDRTGLVNGETLILSGDEMVAGPGLQELTEAAANAVAAQASRIAAELARDAAVSAAGANIVNISFRNAIPGIAVAGGVTHLDVQGFAAAGDGGGGLMRRSAVQSAGNGKVSSLNGVWFEWAPFQPITTRMFGAVANGVADDNVAITNSGAYAATLPNPHWRVSAGVHFSSVNLTVNLGDYSTYEFVGSISSSAARGLQLGTPTGRNLNCRLIGLNVQRQGSFTTSDGSIGLRLWNFVWSRIEVARVWGFDDGLYLDGSFANGGCSYNVITLGQLHDNRKNLRLTASGAGFTNENTFIGGSFNHSTGYPNILTHNVLHDICPNPINNNRYMNPSWEDNNAAAVAMELHGPYNVVFWPRIERPTDQATYPIVFGTTAADCAIIGAGYGIKQSNITDNSTAKTNCFGTVSGDVLRRATQVGVNEQVLLLQSLATSGAALLRGRDSAGVETVRFDGDGSFGLSGTGRIGTPGGSRLLLYNNAGVSARIDFYKTSAANEVGATFYSSTSVAVGSITYSNTATTYNTTSDYRMKLGVTPLSAHGAFIDALRPRAWSWSIDGSLGAGFIAHELAEVSPTSVSGVKDAVDEDGNPVLQAASAASPEIMANIVAELQALRKRVAELEART